MRYVALAVVTVNVGIRAVRQIQNTIIEQLFIQLTRGRVEDAHVGSFIHSYAYRFSASSSCPRILPHEAGKKCHSHNSILKRNYKLTELDNRQSAWYLGLKRKQALATSSFSPTSWLARMSLPNINWHWKEQKSHNRQAARFYLRTWFRWSLWETKVIPWSMWVNIWLPFIPSWSSFPVLSS